VQFERRELGVELVKDTDVMPVEPVICLPQDILQASPKVRHSSSLLREVPTNICMHYTCVRKLPTYICMHYSCVHM